MGDNKDTIITSSQGFAMSEALQKGESSAMVKPLGSIEGVSCGGCRNAENPGGNQRYIEYSDVYSRFYPKEQGH
ncbi:MAG: hypothetical protein CVV27_15340 [Candidatus Melainabacteria bacterium HGW-Melainabacteria-1]|nr:MAG: hypothetical protein CVV27_15340 [Candidatus Melainabacteria bacterium HGW-Melainabacteria-1]